MIDILLIIFIFVSIGFVVFVEVMIKKGKLMRVDTYSYKPVFKRSIIHLNVVIVISLLIYLFSKSFEITISIGILLVLGVIGGLLYGLLWEYQTKRRGGLKKEK